MVRFTLGCSGVYYAPAILIMLRTLENEQIELVLGLFDLVFISFIGVDIGFNTSRYATLLLPMMSLPLYSIFPILSENAGDEFLSYTRLDGRLVTFRLTDVVIMSRLMG